MDLFNALNQALDHVERERPRAVVLTGRAGYFSAGLNVKLLPTHARPMDFTGRPLKGALPKKD